MTAAAVLLGTFANADVVLSDEGSTGEATALSSPVPSACPSVGSAPFSPAMTDSSPEDGAVGSTSAIAPTATPTVSAPSRPELSVAAVASGSLELWASSPIVGTLSSSAVGVASSPA